MKIKNVLIISLAGAMMSGCATEHGRREEGDPTSPRHYEDVVVNNELLPLYKNIKPRTAVLPAAPPGDARHGAQGVIEIDSLVRKDGTVEAVFVRTERVTEGLRQSALRAVQQWKFPVMLRDGEPIRYLANTRIRYRIEVNWGPGGLSDMSGSVTSWSEIE